MRTHAGIKCSIWEDADYLALSDWAKLVYQFLLEQADLTLCGGIPLRLGRWKKTLGSKPDGALEELENANFIVVDWEEEELWIRTFITHGNVWGKGLIGARSSFESVRSPKIRAALALEYPDLASEWGLISDNEGSYQGSDGGSDGGSDQLDTGDERLDTRDERLGEGESERENLNGSAISEGLDSPLALRAHPRPSASPPALVLASPPGDDEPTAPAGGKAPRSARKARSAQPTAAVGEGPCLKCEQGTIRRLGNYIGCSNPRCTLLMPVAS